MLLKVNAGELSFFAVYAEWHPLEHKLNRMIDLIRAQLSLVPTPDIQIQSVVTGHLKGIPLT